MSGSVTTITLEIACIDLHQTGHVGKGSYRLQLIKLWPSRAPGKGVCGWAKNFGSALLQPARSVCVSSERFVHFMLCSVAVGLVTGRHPACKNYLSVIIINNLTLFWKICGYPIVQRCWIGDMNWPEKTSVEFCRDALFPKQINI